MRENGRRFLLAEPNSSSSSHFFWLGSQVLFRLMEEIHLSFSASPFCPPGNSWNIRRWLLWSYRILNHFLCVDEMNASGQVSHFPSLLDHHTDRIVPLVSYSFPFVFRCFAPPFPILFQEKVPLGRGWNRVEHSGGTCREHYH